MPPATGCQYRIIQRLRPQFEFLESGAQQSIDQSGIDLIRTD